MAKAIKKAIAKKVEAPKVTPTEQEIIEVSQEEVKKALKALMTNNEKKAASLLEELYEAHEAYNAEFFFGELNMPFITFEKMDNRTLGNYTHGEDAMGIENHIRFNVNFIALNPMSRVLETLRHEMIHQWQDEVLYYKSGNPRGIRIHMVDEKGKVQVMKIDQKRNPADWHNKDFKEMAKVVGIPAEGDKCYGNPANMPPMKSYNRKYQCSCIASNGYRVSIWSTRDIHAVCQICKKPYVEQSKGGGTVEVTKSHVEKPGENMVEAEMVERGFAKFQSFSSKKEVDTFMDGYEGTMSEHASGVYEKNHNAYKEGFTHWVAWNEKEKAPEKPKKVAPKKAVDKTEEPTDTEKKTEPKAAPQKTAPKKTVKKAKPAPQPEPVIEVPKVEEPEVQPEPPKVEKGEKKMENTNVVEPKPAKVTVVNGRDYTNAQDLLDLYKELGSVKAVAEFFDMTSANVIYHAKKNKVNFKKGVIENE